MTRTIIELSESGFNEIADELIRTGREEAVILEKDRSVSLNMHGICILRKASNVVDFPQIRVADDDELLDFSPEILKGFE
jgi:hypothetical protein